MTKMRLLKSVGFELIKGKTYFTRYATRAICINKKNILLLYTKRYDDYSLPGGGVNPNENIIESMKRELAEETGAQDIKNIEPFGIYDEYRPWYKPDFDIQHMISYCFTCDVDLKLGTTFHEDYEKSNGMRPLWIDINQAIKHNEQVILASNKKGLSIERETFLLKLIAKEKMGIQ